MTIASELIASLRLVARLMLVAVLGIAQAAPGGEAPVSAHPACTNMRFVGHGHSGAGMNEHACRVDRNGVTSYFVQDANNNVAALVSTAGSPIVQYAWTPYGELLAREQFSTHSNNRLGFQGMAADRLSGNVNSTQSLMVGVDGLYQTPNRHYSPVLGRWMQLDPNGTGAIGLPVQSASARSIVPDSSAFAGFAMFADGANRYGCFEQNPISKGDAFGLLIGLIGNGLWSTLDGYLDAEGTLEEIQQGLLTAFSLDEMISEYSALQEHDADWALDWSQDDNWLAPTGYADAIYGLDSDDGATSFDLAVVGKSTKAAKTSRKVGGRLGGLATRKLNKKIAKEQEADGWVVTHGPGSGNGEEYIRGDGPGTIGSTYVDITVSKGDKTRRIQTIDTTSDGLPTQREMNAIKRIKAAYPGDELLTYPKNNPEIYFRW